MFIAINNLFCWQICFVTICYFSSAFLNTEWSLHTLQICHMELMWCNCFVKLKRKLFLNILFFNVRFKTHYICTCIIFIHTETVTALKIRNDVCWDLNYDNEDHHTIFKWSEYQCLLVLKFEKKTHKLTFFTLF